MKKSVSIAVILAFCSTFALLEPALAAPQYLTPQPLMQAVTTPVQSCQKGAITQVPVITWGGDMATIFANGSKRETAVGSFFDKQGLKVKLVREDVFTNQLASYLKCQSPYLRGTMGMINMASELAAKDPRTKLVTVYQLTWSSGGDAMVVKDGINSPRDLRGKSIALQAYGPHVDYLGKILSDAGLGMQDVKIKWVKDLTASADAPAAAFHESGVDAAMVITPDALALTSNGTVGTGAEDSVKGAKILLSTKTANRIISDVYAVRQDYFDANKDEVRKFVLALLQAEEGLRELFKNKATNAAPFQAMLAASGEILLDSAQAGKDAEALYGDAEFVGWKGNVQFFTDANYPRNFDKLTAETQVAFIPLALIKSRVALSSANWDFNGMTEGLKDTGGVTAPKFDTTQVASVVNLRQQQGNLSEGELYSFEVYFQPNQNSFSADLYSDAFTKVIDLASTYGGAIITIEGHSDPLGYLKQKKAGEQELVLNQVKQAAKNLSLTRSNAVRDSLIGFAKGKGVTLDQSQFAVVGHGIARPKSGMCGSDPCAPKTQQEWLNNMRVEFRIIQVEAEESVFKPL